MPPMQSTIQVASVLVGLGACCNAPCVCSSRLLHSCPVLYQCLVPTNDVDCARKTGEQLLRGEFEKLLQMLRPETSVEKADLQRIKDAVFGPQTFFVTETRLTDEYLTDAGWLVRSLS